MDVETYMVVTMATVQSVTETTLLGSKDTTIYLLVCVLHNYV